MGFPLLLLHILRVGKWLFSLLEFLLMRVFAVFTSLVALWHCDCGGGEESSLKLEGDVGPSNQFV